MTKQDLLILLEEVDDDTEIRLMMQPSWPFEYSIAGVILASEITDEDDRPRGLVHDDDEEEEIGGYQPKELAPGQDCLFLVEGSQIGYGTKAAFDDYRRR